MRSKIMFIATSSSTFVRLCDHDRAGRLERVDAACLPHVRKTKTRQKHSFDRT